MLRVRIREVAQEKGMNQLELSFASKVTTTTVNKYWHKNNEHINLAVLEKFARALGVSPMELLEEAPDREAILV